MTKSIAILALGVIQIGVMLANYWYTFGLWPHSWLSFLLCAGAALGIAALLRVIDREP
jgi:hypothetical protein